MTTITAFDKLLGFLVEKNIIKEPDANMVLETHKSTQQPIEELLVSLNLLTKNDLMKARADQMRVEYYDLAQLSVDPEIAKSIPEEICRRHRLIAIGKKDQKLVVAMANPSDLFACDELQLRTKVEILPVLSEEKEINVAIDKIYKMSENWQKIIAQIQQKPLLSMQKKRVDIEGIEGPVIRLGDLIIQQAVEQGASDIHIEVFEDEMKIRYRIDGVLHEAMNPPRNIHPPLITRFKVMADLDLAEKRLPQDGRMNLVIANKSIDFRISSVPSIYGEKMVMRLLDRSSMRVSLTDLGFADDNLQKINSLIHQPHGIILVTGPTGSGKTTTLYSALNSINDKTINILTIEDPVEYYLKGINQIQAHPKIGLTFASGLRAFLRQDPDVIMVGEIRDTETAEIAIESALTGHLVLSTLHTNDSVSSIARLIDMAIEPFLLASGLNAILAQRLVRKICRHCKKPINIETQDLEIFKKFGIAAEKITAFKGTGCPMCKNSGYKGRSGIYELLIVSNNIKDLIMKKASSHEMTKVAKEEGLVTLLEDGLEKVANGITTLEEIWRVTKE